MSTGSEHREDRLPFSPSGFIIAARQGARPAFPLLVKHGGLHPGGAGPQFTEATQLGSAEPSLGYNFGEGGSRWENLGGGDMVGIRQKGSPPPSTRQWFLGTQMVMEHLGLCKTMRHQGIMALAAPPHPADPASPARRK